MATSPPVLAIGATGHRALDAVATLRDRVDAAIAIAHADASARLGTEPSLRAVSSLAEGADRLVAEAVLRRPGATLEVVLPLEAGDYADDFDTADSKQAFTDLLGRADELIRVEPQTTREGAYEAAGRRVVHDSDVLVALWDGKPARGRGGTAEIVAYAIERGVRVLWVQTEEPHALVELPSRTVLDGT